MTARSSADFQIPDENRTPDLSDLEEFAKGKVLDRKRQAHVAKARDDDAVEQETENTFADAEDLPEEDSN
jgi:hypothetical protein